MSICEDKQKCYCQYQIDQRLPCFAEYYPEISPFSHSSPKNSTYLPSHDNLPDFSITAFEPKCFRHASPTVLLSTPESFYSCSPQPSSPTLCNSELFKLDTSFSSTCNFQLVSRSSSKDDDSFPQLFSNSELNSDCVSRSVSWSNLPYSNYNFSSDTESLASTNTSRSSLALTSSESPSPSLQLSSSYSKSSESFSTSDSFSFDYWGYSC